MATEAVVEENNSSCEPVAMAATETLLDAFTSAHPGDEQRQEWNQEGRVAAAPHWMEWRPGSETQWTCGRHSTDKPMVKDSPCPEETAVSIHKADKGWEEKQKFSILKYPINFYLSHMTHHSYPTATEEIARLETDSHIHLKRVKHMPEIHVNHKETVPTLEYIKLKERAISIVTTYGRSDDDFPDFPLVVLILNYLYSEFRFSGLVA
ncbi:uncharacterized protein LOC142827432 [Pelodiscus sinensis]|uniref:uncharacterized protein LOC142827432 n=1 Tax=Pelodiscus sinensis TaxID=13735 RepID=UPI003F6CF400